MAGERQPGAGAMAPAAENGTGQPVYGAIAKAYDLLDLPFEYLRYRPVRRVLWQGLSGRILDAGVGTGRNMPFYPEDADITGIDLSAQMLSRARRRQARLGVCARLLQADAVDTGLEAGSFDAVVSSFMFCVLPDELQLPALRELARLTRPGGQIRVLEYTLSEHPLRRRIMRLWAPWVEFAYGARFDRHTEQYVVRAGLKLVEDRFVHRDMLRLLVMEVPR